MECSFPCKCDDVKGQTIWFSVDESDSSESEDWRRALPSPEGVPRKSSNTPFRLSSIPTTLPPSTPFTNLRTQGTQTQNQMRPLELETKEFILPNHKMLNTEILKASNYCTCSDANRTELGKIMKWGSFPQYLSHGSTCILLQTHFQQRNDPSSVVECIGWKWGRELWGQLWFLHLHIQKTQLRFRLILIG